MISLRHWPAIPSLLTSTVLYPTGSENSTFKRLKGIESFGDLLVVSISKTMMFRLSKKNKEKSVLQALISMCAFLLVKYKYYKKYYKT